MNLFYFCNLCNNFLTTSPPSPPNEFLRGKFIKTFNFPSPVSTNASNKRGARTVVTMPSPSPVYLFTETFCLLEKITWCHLHYVNYNDFKLEMNITLSLMVYNTDSILKAKLINAMNADKVGSWIPKRKCFLAIMLLILIIRCYIIYMFVKLMLMFIFCAVTTL